MSFKALLNDMLKKEASISKHPTQPSALLLLTENKHISIIFKIANIYYDTACDFGER